MKKTTLFTGLITMLMFSSCYEFNRQQDLKNARNKGEMVIAEAENSKKALIETAKAENESATLKAEAMIKIAKAEAAAEVERAKGVSEANKIIGESLRGNAEYIQYLQIDAIKNSKGDKVYIATEAGLPIIERGK